jgi:probable HAF family extracellular repeat protein
MKRFLYGLVALGLLLASAAQAIAQPGYVYSTLDVPGATRTGAFAINNLGQIVGSYADARGGHDFLLSGGNFITLNLPGSPSGLNDSGQIVGTTKPPYLGGPRHGYLFSGGSTTMFDVPGAFGTFASGINGSGQVVGSYFGSSRFSPSHGYLLSGSQYTTLDAPGAFSTELFGINAAGQIVGGSSNGAFLLTGGRYITLAVPGAIGTSPVGINDSGQIVGTWADGGTHSFVYDNGSYTTLAVPGSIVTFADGINDAGQIVGEYEDADHVFHGFVATPVPEPATLLMLGVATLGMIGYALRQRGGRPLAP